MTGFSHLGANITKMNTTEIQVYFFLNYQMFREYFGSKIIQNTAF